MLYRYDGIDINITIQGTGEPVFLLHGWGCTGEIFKHIAQVLSTAYTTYSRNIRTREIRAIVCK